MKARYFQDELAYLRESGRFFAQNNPKLSRYLSERSTDPDVERLLEGFAFLTSKLREKLDDELPELTHSVINLLMPNFLRPFPATTLMKLSPVEKAFTERHVVPAKSKILSRAVDDVICPFRTTADTDVYPLEIVEQHLERTRQSTDLAVKFQTLSGLPTSKIGLKDLRLWMCGDPVSAQLLYLWIGRYLKKLTLVIQGDGEQGEIQRKYDVPLRQLSPGGFGADESILPNGNASYEGYRLLQEYFVFPHKFQCFDLKGLSSYFQSGSGIEFTLLFEFERPLPPSVKVRPDSIRLYCVPAVNLFQYDAEPMNVDHRKLRYPIRPSGDPKNSIDIFSITNVVSWRAVEDLHTRSHLREYPTFESFHHEVERADGMMQIYYRLRLREALRGRGMEHLVSFVRHDSQPAIPEHEVLSAELLCFNGHHAQELATGDICIPTEETPSYVKFENLLQPTQPVFPPLDGSLYWSLISNLSLNYVSLLSKEALETVISAYDFQARSDRQAERVSKQRMKGIVSIDTKPVDKLFRGQAVRGLTSRMTMSEEAFQSEGDMYVFASVLAEFFSLYSSVNSFHELIMEGVENNEVYKWPAKIGRQPLI
ncbi:type VI secretion system baseplate subunit TssF [Flexibacterium corallicola]|uniref:type VI secretion system baseplate subunit TssF n=1 Tax=Flexibacterium corallicola TaxID=3037259 RepID=UPI00286FA192|nr:type VI secretion system baseplate subunit TssF [Pseudovibrio sp. M1P-2-3]